MKRLNFKLRVFLYFILAAVFPFIVSWICIYYNLHIKMPQIMGEAEYMTAMLRREVYIPLFSFAILSIVLVILASYLLVGAISAPLIRLRDGAKAIAEGNLNYKLDIAGSIEIKEVAHAFNTMSDHLNGLYQDLVGRTDALYQNNTQLQAINTELEASYEQLGAAMQQLNASEEKYRTLMDNISDMVFVISSEYKILYINNRVEKILGHTESDLIGHSIESLLKDKRQIDSYKTALAWDYYEYQMELIKKDGGTIIVEGSTKRLVEGENIIGIQAIARDITHKKAMEVQLGRKYDELQVLNRVSRAITSTIDLNTVLHIVVNQVIDISGALVCAVTLIDGKGVDAPTIKAVQGIRMDKMNRSDNAVKKDVVGRATEKRQPVIIDLTQEAPQSDYFKLLFQEESARYATYNPLTTQGKIIGVMCTITKTQPSNEQIELLSSLANSIAIAVDNAKAYDDLKQSYLKTVQSLISAVEAKDVYTESHSIRVAKYASFIASEMGCPKKFIQDIWVAGVLHDIGKIGISDAILNKKGKLTDEEYAVIKQHPEIAYRILQNIGLQEDILRAIHQHHERYDGRGYPQNTPGDNILKMAAIISVADSFDAITSRRPYKEAKSIRQGINEIVKNRGMQFDPKIVDVFETAYLMKWDVVEQIYNNEEVEFF